VVQLVTYHAPEGTPLRDGVRSCRAMTQALHCLPEGRVAVQVRIFITTIQDFSIAKNTPAEG
jgi:hypothetical protein